MRRTRLGRYVAICACWANEVWKSDVMNIWDHINEDQNANAQATPFVFDVSTSLSHIQLPCEIVAPVFNLPIRPY